MWCVMTESKIKQSESEVKKATEYNYLLIRSQNQVETLTKGIAENRCYKTSI